MPLPCNRDASVAHELCSGLDSPPKSGPNPVEWTSILATAVLSLSNVE